MINFRTCVNSSKKTIYLKEGENVASQTVPIEAIFTMLVINAYEGRYVATFDVSGDYLHEEMPIDKITLLKLQGQFVDIICDTNPDHKENARYENVKKYYIYLYYRLFMDVLNHSCCVTSYTPKISIKIDTS